MMNNTLVATQIQTGLVSIPLCRKSTGILWCSWRNKNKNNNQNKLLFLPLTCASSLPWWWLSIWNHDPQNNTLSIVFVVLAPCASCPRTFDAPGWKLTNKLMTNDQDLDKVNGVITNRDERRTESLSTCQQPANEELIFFVFSVFLLLVKMNPSYKTMTATPTGTAL